MNSQRAIGLLVAFVVFAVLLIILGMCVGSAGFENVLTPLIDPSADRTAFESAHQIVFEIRLPRTLGAWAAGALLGLAGAIAQGLFRNPLADPFLLGSASGASLGVALTLAALGGGVGIASAAIVNGDIANVVFSSTVWGRVGLTGAAFVGAMIAVSLTLMMSGGVQHSLRLLLAGVIIGVVLGAATQIVLLISPQSLQSMQAFMLGTTSFVDWTATAMMVCVWLGCITVAVLLARVLDGLWLGEATARSLGLSLGPMRATLVIVLALATGTAVAQTGLIAFVGLVAPHLVRAIVKTTNRLMLILASCAGGSLLMLADISARWLIAPQELPVGILTAILGGAYLLWLMRKGSSSFQRGLS